MVLRPGFEPGSAAFFHNQTSRGRHT